MVSLLRYLFNPYTLLSCLAKSTTTLDNTLLLTAIAFACEGLSVPASFLLAVAAHTSLYPALLLPAIAMQLAAVSKPTGTVTQNIVLFIGSFSLLTGLNSLMVGWSWILPTWGVIITVSDLTPNVGMWWYFFTEMFDHFRTFFLGVFQLHNLIYVAPICLRLRHDPLFAILILVAIFGTWKSYPTLGDTAPWVGLLGCFPEVTSNLRHPLFTLAVHLYTSILLPLLHSLWLLTGTGNANFFYAATMVYGLNASLAIVDVLGAGIKSAFQRQVEAIIQESPRDTSQNFDEAHLEQKWERRDWVVVQLTKHEA